MKNNSAYNKIIRSRNELVLNHPFFASLALRLELVEDKSCQTAWTDGKKFAYNPDYVESLPMDKLVGLSAHTVMHPACGHHKRRNGREPDAWNRACDYSINWILLDAGLKLPDGFLYSEKFIGKSADFIYERISKGEEEKSEKQTISEQNMEDNFSDDETELKRSGKDESSEGDDKSEVLSETDPNGDGENPESGQGDPGMAGEVRDSSVDELEGDSDSEGDWDLALVQAALNARGAGMMPAGLERFVQRRINPSLPWNELLSRFIENSARSDYSWVQPNRRFIHQNVYFPSLKNSELAEIVIVFDSSGSVTPAETDVFSAELSGILETLPSRIHIMSVDMNVNTFETITRSDLPFQFNPVGGGGTDFRPAFHKVQEENINPACLIYLTDLQCRKFPEEPHYPVLWVKTGNGEILPPFGETIELEQ